LQIFTKIFSVEPKVNARITRALVSFGNPGPVIRNVALTVAAGIVCIRSSFIWRIPMTQAKVLLLTGI
jgi:hypothetical protein